MNQGEEDSFYHSLGEEASDVECLLVEPKSDQVSVNGVWCYDEKNLGKCVKPENAPYNLGIQDSNQNMEGVDTTIHNAFDGLPTNVSSCDDYLLGYVSNEGLHAGNSQFPMKGSFGIQNSLTENILGIEYQNYLISNGIFGTSTNSCEPKTLDRFEDFSSSFNDQENNHDTLPPHFPQNGSEPVEDHGSGLGEITQKRSRKRTKRYIDESSVLSLNNSKKRREAGPKVKLPGGQSLKSQTEVKPKEKSQPDDPFDKAIQVPFSPHIPIEYRKNESPAKNETRIDSYSSDPEDDSETITRAMPGGNPRKLHRVWAVSEVKKLLDGVSRYGVGKWTHIKKSHFSSSDHRTSVDLKDKWRNLLKASGLKESGLEFYNLKQEGGDNATYTNRFHELSILCPDLVRPLARGIKKYIRGLPMPIQDSVLSSGPKVLSDAITLAATLTDNHVKAGTWTKGSTKKPVEKATTEPTEEVEAKTPPTPNDQSHHTKHNHNYHRKRKNYAVTNQSSPPPQNPQQHRFVKPYTGPHPLCNTCQRHHPTHSACRHCSNCNRYGHLHTSCHAPIRTQLNAAPYTILRVCYHCGDPNHFRNACPQLAIANQAQVYQAYQPQAHPHQAQWTHVPQAHLTQASFTSTAPIQAQPLQALYPQSNPTYEAPQDPSSSSTQGRMIYANELQVHNN